MTNLRNATILLLFVILWGCSSANDKTVILDANGKHPAGWAVAVTGGQHPVAYRANQSACVECHGSATDKNSTGGTSGISCFSASRSGITCHPNGPSGHPAGWSAPGSHGSAAKAAAPGLSYCTQCHGSNYTGGAGKSCMTCHTTAPHPAKPWRGTTSTGTSHTTTNQSNVAECARCHLNNQRLAVPQAVPAGTTPGCFNNTLCHAVMGHNSDPQPWSDPVNHGARAASEPIVGGNTGLGACQQCHGTDFSGGSAKKTCFTCHGVNAPHPKRADWTVKAGTLSHVKAGEGNATVCATCHNSGTKNLSDPYLTRFASAPAGSFTGTPPNCYTATMCHGDVRKTTNCDACHSTATTNPFKSMAGATAPTDPKVGAHVKHLNAATQTPVYSANIACAECHTFPASPAISGTHRNGTNDIVFGALAKTGSLTPTYTSSTGVCANTYCHGNSLDKPATAVLSPTWNAPFLTGVAASDCTKCHGYPPATATHTGKTPTMCAGCHVHVNSTGTGFVDPTKHINGVNDYIGEHPAGWSAPASHGTAAKATPDASHGFTYCTSCHIDYVSGSGTSCKSCHKTAPHPVAPWRGTTTTHTTTDQGNASECSRCHAGGVKLSVPVAALAGATCFNNLLCHGAVVAHAVPNPGSLHKSSTSGCDSCHKLGTSSSVYPATSTPPDCKSCHNLSTATSMALMSGCSDCHGDAATGRPNSGAFPNRRGQHFNGNHVGRACTVCHPFTSGDPRHGWSGHVKSTSAQVTAPGWNAASKSCNNSCHDSVVSWY